MHSRKISLLLGLALSVPQLAQAEAAAAIDAGPAAAPSPPAPKEPEARRLWLRARLDEILERAVAGPRENVGRGDGSGERKAHLREE